MPNTRRGALIQGDRDHPIPRVGARVLLLDARDRFLLLKIEDRETGAAPFWKMPGGGIEPGESPGQAALRELQEEVGLHSVALGPCLWRERDTFMWRDRWYRSDQSVFLVRVHAHEVAPARLGAMEQQLIAEFRWWSAPEVVAAKGETFIPTGLAALVRPIIEGRIPETPLEIGG